jgi:hypothetical protein
MMNAEEAITHIIAEYDHALKQNGPFNSPHEGIAVIWEEVDELWEDIRADGSLRANEIRERAAREAAQVGAMALRFMVDFA